MLKSKKSILITGATGFIGRNLVESLCPHYCLYAPTHQELNLLDEKMVYEFIKINKIDIVIHTANTNNFIHNEFGEYEQLNNNLRMFFNLERCHNLYSKMLYFGSGAEYDMNHYRPKMKEEYFDSYVPSDAYGYSKYIMSKVSKESNNIYDLRLFGVCGKYEEWERRFISNAICRGINGLPITINKNIFFDYLYIDDLANIMYWFIENNPKYTQYNICTGISMDLYTIAQLVKKTLKLDIPIIVHENGFKPEYSGNNERLLRELGDFSFVKMDKIVEEMCNYYIQNKEAIDFSILK